MGADDADVDTIDVTQIATAPATGRSFRITEEMVPVINNARPSAIGTDLLL